MRRITRSSASLRIDHATRNKADGIISIPRGYSHFYSDAYCEHEHESMVYTALSVPGKVRPLGSFHEIHQEKLQEPKPTAVLRSSTAEGGFTDLADPFTPLHPITKIPQLAGYPPFQAAQAVRV